ncbi:MAG: carbohydrate ABC transporter permease [Thermomicrobiales bacterium]
MGVGGVAALLTRRRAANQRPPWQEPPHPVVQAIKALVLVVIAVVMIFPFIYVIAVSFSSYRDVIGGGLIIFPGHPTLDAYRTILRGDIITQALIVSIGITTIGTALKLLATVTMAYALTRTGPGGVRGSRFVLIVVLFTLLFSPGLIPRYLVVKELNMLDTYASLVLPGLISAFNLVVLRNFFMNIPQELLDSARIDGANDLRILWNIVLPLSKAVLAVIALFYGVALWNDFFAATLYLNDPRKWPIQLVLRQYVLLGSPLVSETREMNQPLPPPQTIQMAVLVVATVPILLVYPLLQKYFTKGVLTGAIKG